MKDHSLHHINQKAGYAPKRPKGGPYYKGNNN